MQRYQKDILAVFIPQRAGPLGARKYLLAVDPRNGGVIGAASIWRQHGPLGSLTGSVSTRRAQPGTGSVRPRPAGANLLYWLCFRACCSSIKRFRCESRKPSGRLQLSQTYFGQGGCEVGSALSLSTASSPILIPTGIKGPNAPWTRAPSTIHSSLVSALTTVGRKIAKARKV